MKIKIKIKLFKDVRHVSTPQIVPNLRQEKLNQQSFSSGMQVLIALQIFDGRFLKIEQLVSVDNQRVF